MIDQTPISAFNKIYDATNRKTLIYITSKCGNPDDISDIFQETYTELFKILSKQGENYIQNYEAFVFRLAKQKIFKHYALFEKLKLFVPLKSKNKDDDEFDIIYNDPTDFSFENMLVQKELLTLIHDYLGEKQPVVRKIFYLYYSLDLKISDIAKELDLSESNVKNKLYRTLLELRNKFKM